MTNKEAIELIKNMIDREAIGFVVPEGDGDVAIWQYHVEALEMAITALDQLDNNSTKPDNSTATQSNGIESKVKGMTACRVPEDDAISRKAAINEINERQRKLIYCFGFENDAVKIMDIAKSIVIAIPSVQPEIVRCKDCKFYSPMNRETKTGICNLTMHQNFGDDWYCAGAERRIDERQT